MTLPAPLQTLLKREQLYRANDIKDIILQNFLPGEQRKGRKYSLEKVSFVGLVGIRYFMPLSPDPDPELDIFDRMYRELQYSSLSREKVLSSLIPASPGDFTVLNIFEKNRDNLPEHMRITQFRFSRNDPFQAGYYLDT